MFMTVGCFNVCMFGTPGLMCFWFVQRVNLYKCMTPSWAYFDVFMGVMHRERKGEKQHIFN